MDVVIRVCVIFKSEGDEVGFVFVLLECIVKESVVCSRFIVVDECVDC